MEDLRYPVGQFELPAVVSAGEREAHIRELEQAPTALQRAVDGLDEAQLATPYRPDGWTVRQVAHHLADSHLNAYVRFRLALTEDEPVVRPYDEALWAELPDARTGPLDLSLPLLEALHRRWTTMLRALDATQWARPYRHTQMGPLPLDRALAMYAWHGRHHIAHITSLRARSGWLAR
jgi:hypothetical protein